MQVHNEAHMKAILTFTTPAIVASMFMIYWYLLQIEINKTLTLPTGLESVGSHEDFAKKKKSNEASETSASASAMSAGSAIMEEEDQPPEGETPGDGGVVAKTTTTTGVDTEDEQPRRFRISKLRNIVLVLLSLGLSLVTYLILVVSSAPIWLRLLGVLAVIGMGLWQQIGEELRRQRLDRIVGIMTMILLAASLMSVATYANKSLQEGEIYQGKARVVGFNYANYDNNDGDITRTDLEVAWGGEWGCPTEGGKQCQAFVQGAMCEAEKEEKDQEENHEEDEVDNDGGKIRRHLGNNDNEKDNNNGDGEENQNGEDGAQEEEEDLEEDLEEEEEENQELEEENQEEEQELEEYEEYTDELEEEVESGAQYNYYWDDDMMYDAYWDEQDWGSVWGDYACYDLFDYDMSGSTYNADEAPGYDDWPFVNIYGNCKKCDAYIVDYFSTQHFQDIQDYRVQGRNYLILSVFGLVLTALLHLKHKTDPIAEKELELLPNDGGALA